MKGGNTGSLGLLLKYDLTNKIKFVMLGKF